jgi:hypothetical protein
MSILTGSGLACTLTIFSAPLQSQACLQRYKDKNNPTVTQKRPLPNIISTHPLDIRHKVPGKVGGAHKKNERISALSG